MSKKYEEESEYELVEESEESETENENENIDNSALDHPSIELSKDQQLQIKPEQRGISIPKTVSINFNYM